jgi:hypothetical protein
VAELFATGRVVDWILLFMLFELIALTIVRKRSQSGIGIGPFELVVGMSAGAALLMALRAALDGARWPQVAVWLAVALVAHLWDLGLRLRAH